MRTSLKLFSLVLGLSFCLLLSCKKEDETVAVSSCNGIANRTCVGYLETYCLNGWGQNFISDEQLITAIIEYLETRQIDLTQIHIEVTSSPDPGNACVSKTGRTIYGSVANEDLEAIKELRFFEL